jgi:uncharacterized membrane protein YidH (DUF202 family)
MASQLENVPLIAGASLRLTASAWWPPWMPHTMSGLTLLQVLIICAASVATMVVLWQVRRQQERSSRAAWLVTVGVFVVFGVSALAMVI